MLNFAEQTGSGAVIVVWSFLPAQKDLAYITLTVPYTCHSLILKGAFPLYVGSDPTTSPLALLLVKVQSLPMCHNLHALCMSEIPVVSLTASPQFIQE